MTAQNRPKMPLRRQHLAGQTFHRRPEPFAAIGVDWWGEWLGGMAREVNKLTARKVQAITLAGRHADGGGLYLVVEAGGAKRWVMLYRMNGRRREMGLGAAQSVPLIKARELAADARGQIAAGVDPIEARAQAAVPATAPAAPVTFADVANTYMADREKVWRNEAHRNQWRQTLEVQAKPIWRMPVAGVGTDDVLAVLRPLWHAKPETARRIRGRLERILDAARVGGHRAGENPARWRGHLDVLLPKAVKLSRGHHPALPYNEVPAFYRELVETRRGMSAVALRLLTLTAARSGEVRGMVWSEVDIAAARWVVPAGRMKAGREHRVPLCAEALQILSEMVASESEPDGLIFPSRANTPLSDMALGMMLRKMGLGQYTVHGLRSSFRDWVSEETDFARDLAEVALAHLVGDETERAYRRGDALEKRRHLMDAWAAFVVGESGAPSKMRVSSS